MALGFRGDWQEDYKPQQDTYVTGFYNKSENKIHIEYGKPFPFKREVAILTIEDFSYITNTDFKARFGGDKPIFNQLNAGGQNEIS